jgi:hypothetical protein
MLRCVGTGKLIKWKGWLVFHARVTSRTRETLFFVNNHLVWNHGSLTLQTARKSPKSYQLHNYSSSSCFRFNHLSETVKDFWVRPRSSYSHTRLTQLDGHLPLSFWRESADEWRHLFITSGAFFFLSGS